jgi:phage terminase Nu1 subunit (DNA packaging protein)
MQLSQSQQRTLTQNELNYISDSIDSASSPEDIQAAAELIAEAEARLVERSKWDLVSLTEVAEFFGLDEHTVRQWRLKTPPMPGEPGKWPIKQIVKWRCDWIQQSDLAAAKRQQDFDLGAIALERERIELAKEKAEILDRSDVELWASTALTELREGIMQLPEMLAASAPQEIKDFAREEADRHCRDLLEATAKRLEMAELTREQVIAETERD